MKSILFLDFDGVLNNTAWMILGSKKKLSESRWERDLSQFDPDNISALNRFLEKSPSTKIVISSSWRYGMTVEDLKKLLGALSVDPSKVIDKTPHSTSAEKNGIWISETRGQEIKRWLDSHPEVESFAIIDDDRDMDSVSNHLVQTNRQVGMVDGDVEACIRKLARRIK